MLFPSGGTYFVARVGMAAALQIGEKARRDFIGLAELAEIDDAELRHGSEVLSTYSAADAELLTRPKEKLAVFWTAEVERPARDLLDKDEG